MIAGTLIGYIVFWLKGPRQVFTEQLIAIKASIESLENKGVSDKVIVFLRIHYGHLQNRVDPDVPGFKAKLKRFMALWSKKESLADRPDPSLDSTLSTDIATLRTAIASANILQQLCVKVEQDLSSDQKRLDYVRKQIEAAWRAIVVLDVATAGSTMNAIEAELFDPDSIDAAIATAAATSTATAAAAVALASHAVSPSLATPATRLKATRIRAAGNLQGAVRTIQFMRSFATSFGIVLIFFSGLNLLYVNVPGFGHSIYDYLKAIAWGFGTGAAGRGLSTTLASWAGNLLQ